MTTQPPGGAVVVEVEITDGAAPEGFALPLPASPRFTPSEGVTWTVTTPSGGATATTDAVMTPVGVGRVRATHAIPLDAPPGLYGAEITAHHGGEQVSQRYGLFVVEALADP